MITTYKFSKYVSLPFQPVQVVELLHRGKRSAPSLDSTIHQHHLGLLSGPYCTLQSPQAFPGKMVYKKWRKNDKDINGSIPCSSQLHPLI